MSDIATTLQNLQTQFKTMSSTLDDETAAGATANAKAAAAKRAVAQTQALLSRTQAAGSAADAKQKQINDADAAWKKVQGAAPAMDVGAFGKALAGALGLAPEDLDKGKSAVQGVDNPIQALGAKEAAALKKTQAAQAEAAADLDKAAQALDAAVQVLKDLTTKLAAQQKAAADTFGDGQKLAKSSDPDSLSLAVVRYVDLATQQADIDQTAKDYKPALDAANAAYATWKGKVADAAAAEAAAIQAQLDFDAATVGLSTLQQNRDTAALAAVQKALPKPKAKVAAAPSATPAKASA
jgi:colicin import membrane protein